MYRDLWQLAKKTISTSTAKTVKPLGSGNAVDIINCINAVYPAAVEQTKRFAKALYQEEGGDVTSLLRDLYWTVCKNVNLNYDPIGVQYIRKPANLVAEHTADCKSFSIFLSSVLTNLRIPNVMRFVAWQLEGEIQHVYVVAFPGTSRQTFLDCNLKDYNKEKTPHYNEINIDMTKIFGIGRVPSGRPSNAIGKIYDALDHRRTLLETEKAADHAISGTKSRQYDAAINYIGDLEAAVSNIATKGGPWIRNAKSIIAGIDHDWQAGRYHQLSGQQVRRLRAREWDKGIRYKNKSKIGALIGFSLSNLDPTRGLKNLGKWTKKKIDQATDWVKKETDQFYEWQKNKVNKAWHWTGDALKKAGVFTWDAVWTTLSKTAEGVWASVIDSFELGFDITKASVIAPATLFDKKAGSSLKKLLTDSIVDDWKDIAGDIKKISQAPAAGILKAAFQSDIKKFGFMFVYSAFIDKKDLSKYTETIKKKWEKQKKIQDKLILWAGLNKHDFKQMAKEGTKKRVGLNPDEYIASVMNGTVLDKIKIDTDGLDESRQKSAAEIYKDLQEKYNSLSDDEKNAPEVLFVLKAAKESAKKEKQQALYMGLGQQHFFKIKADWDNLGEEEFKKKNAGQKWLNVWIEAFSDAAVGEPLIIIIGAWVGLVSGIVSLVLSVLKLCGVFDGKEDVYETLTGINDGISNANAFVQAGYKVYTNADLVKIEQDIKEGKLTAAEVQEIQKNINYTLSYIQQNAGATVQTALSSLKASDGTSSSSTVQPVDQNLLNSVATSLGVKTEEQKQEENNKTLLWILLAAGGGAMLYFVTRKGKKRKR